MGAVVQARILRERLVEADRAKTTFISQVREGADMKAKAKSLTDYS